MADRLTTLPGHGIIYALTVRDAEMVTAWLTSRGFAVAACTGESGESGESGEHREALEQDLLHNRVKALVATTALRMGYDKADLAFVIDYRMPGSVVAIISRSAALAVALIQRMASCSADSRRHKKALVTR